MITRRLFAATLVLGIAVPCGMAFAQAAEPTVALVQINQQALFFNQMNQGATAAAEKAGAKLVIFNANNDPAAQNNAIETYVAEGVGAIIVVAIDVNGVMPAVQQAADAGIPVLAVDAILPAGPHKSQIGVDNEGAGAEIGQAFLDYVKEDEEGPPRSASSARSTRSSRISGRRASRTPSRATPTIKVAGVVDGRNIQDNALAAAETLITGNPDMTAVYATGEPALVGAVAAVEAQGATDRVKVFGWDLTEQVIKGIDDGFVIAVVQQDPERMGAVAVESALTLINGGTVDPVIPVPVTIVTKENVDKFRAMFQ